jgi:hypothetical protein
VKGHAQDVFRFDLLDMPLIGSGQNGSSLYPGSLGSQYFFLDPLRPAELSHAAEISPVHC